MLDCDLQDVNREANPSSIIDEGEELQQQQQQQQQTSGSRHHHHHHRSRRYYNKRSGSGDPPPHCVTCFCLSSDRPIVECVSYEAVPTLDSCRYHRGYDESTQQQQQRDDFTDSTGGRCQRRRSTINDILRRMKLSSSVFCPEDDEGESFEDRLRGGRDHRVRDETVESPPPLLIPSAKRQQQQPRRHPPGQASGSYRLENNNSSASQLNRRQVSERSNSIRRRHSSSSCERWQQDGDAAMQRRDGQGYESKIDPASEVTDEDRIAAKKEARSRRRDKVKSAEPFRSYRVGEESEAIDGAMGKDETSAIQIEALDIGGDTAREDNLPTASTNKEPEHDSGSSVASILPNDGNNNNNNNMSATTNCSESSHCSQLKLVRCEVIEHIYEQTCRLRRLQRHLDGCSPSPVRGETRTASTMTSARLD